MGGQPDDITQTTEPPAFVKPYIQDVLNQSRNLFQNYTPQYFPGSTVAPISPYTSQATDQLAGFGNSSFNTNVLGGSLQAQNQLLNQANPAIQAGAGQTSNAIPFYDYLRANAVSPQQSLQGQITQPGINVPGTSPTAVERAAGDVNAGQAIQGTLNRAPGANPYVDELVQRVLAANTQSLQQGVLPQIANQSQLEGGYGGSRQGVAEGLALQGLADANARTAAGIYSDQYNQDLSRQLQAANLASGLQAQSSNAELSRQAGDRGFGLNAAGLNLQGQGLGLNAGIADRSYQNALAQQALQGSQLGQNLLTSGLQAGLGGSQAALALSPGLQQAGLTGTQALAQAGDIDNAYRQALLQDTVNRFNYGQELPYAQLQQYANNVIGQGGLGFGQSLATPTSSGGVAGALGGAATGVGLLGGATQAGLLSAGTASGPIGWGIVGLGALLGSGLLS